ncbi:endoplasmic reticulum vesicle transporter-domain-containing protein [Gongronella butleri]|nr:endoplasmic reticulum vesicle transporter-domain-containing protein [Gongronella butleri]
MLSKSFVNKFKRLDAYAKTIDDFRIRTRTGALVTLVSAGLILFFVLIELWAYLFPIFQSEVVVDGGKMEKLPIHFDITFPHIPCHQLSLDIMDESGEHINHFSHDVFKSRLDANGKEIDKQKQTQLRNSMAADEAEFREKTATECGSCYGAGAEGECCNTCDQVRQLYSTKGWNFEAATIEQCVREGLLEALDNQSKEGCRMFGHLEVNKLRGNFHFSPGQSFTHGSQHMHDVRTYLGNKYDFKHTINHLQFGDQQALLHKHKRTQAMALINPLDGTDHGSNDAGMMYQFYLKIVPTQFDFLGGKMIRTFQYSASRQERFLDPMQGISGVPGNFCHHGGGRRGRGGARDENTLTYSHKPARTRARSSCLGVFFHLDFSPMRVIYREDRPMLASVLVSICAIVGGIFTVASVIDGALYRAMNKEQHGAHQFTKAN